MPYVESQILVKGNPEEVYKIARDMEKFPEYMRDVEEVNVLEKNGSSTMTEWVTNIEGTPIIWTEEDKFDDENLKIQYKLIEGDLEKFEGEWNFLKKDTGCLVVLSVDYDFGMPSLTELIGPTLETKVRENSEMMLQGMKKKIEG
ncbi:MAG: SRPBCC family protein [Candidatus Eremiobacteraeota bacterium]|nr:SRPBCC family protein [Candidatus Eremiobacteraeota bacterium]